ncbi:hypothetical protein Salat_2122200 [Sesamum alatum]|uniref:Uncharacterized protein n=1 Tax=Sesamum alatum TaxID=300844 RepID=A0AAE2CGT7_9LAMI|nr:hypothetical protein Salat_2122200 [Sesamum alatum]
MENWAKEEPSKGLSRLGPPPGFSRTICTGPEREPKSMVEIRNLASIASLSQLAQNAREGRTGGRPDSQLDRISTADGELQARQPAVVTVTMARGDSCRGGG